MSAPVTPLPTPWGPAVSVEQIAPGIVFVETASHGGFYLDETRNGQVPGHWRRASFNRRALDGWYEEDCDACLIVVAFPQEFPAEALPRAKLCFDRWFKPKLQGEYL